MTCSRIARANAARAILALLTIGAANWRATAGDAAEAPATRTAVRSGNHAEFGRVVIDANGATAYQLDQDGDHVTVRFTGGVMLGNSPTLPRNIVAIKTSGATIELTLKHGAKLRPMRMDGRVILDAWDAPDSTAAPGTVRPSEVLAAPRTPSPLTMALSPELAGRAAITPVTVPTIRAPVEPQPAAVATRPIPLPAVPEPRTIETSQQTPPGRDVMPEKEGPIALQARRLKLPKGTDGSAFLVPFESTTGAASFRSADNTYIVFDERRPVDMAALKGDPVFGGASVQLLPNGTLFRVPLSPPRSIALTQMSQGWRIAALATATKQQPIAVSQTGGRLNLTADQSGEVVHLADPDTGATLLVGTQHRPGQGVATSRRGAEFILRPTTQGVVVEPLSDAIALKQIPTGFSLSGGPTGLMLSPTTGLTDALMDAAQLTRRLDFSTIPTDALLRRATKQLAEAAMSPPMARGPKHHLAAESFMALGLAAEAQSLLHMAAEQDPKEAASPETSALMAIAAMLAGRTEDADGIMDPRLDGTDEILLWRAIRQAMLDEGSPAAAAVFSATAPLVFQYPRPIREHILPLIVETMIKGGEITPAAHLLDVRKDDPKLAFARALMRQAEGDTDQALSMFDAVAAGRDQFDRARAAIRAVELRLTVHKLDKMQSADALDKLLYAWRGDARELALRERVADLRGQTGAWRIALTTLRQAETDFPEQASQIHERLKDMFAGMIRDQGDHQASPIDFVSTVDENTDLLSNNSDDEGIRQSLADRLLALDLPDRAKPVLDKLMRSAKTDVAKARFGASLATLESREGNDAAVQTVLAGSDGRDLPPELIEQRMILRAGAVAHLGDPPAAAALLAPFLSARATEARAQILENASDWAGAKQAWADCAALTLPEGGMLDEGQTRTVLRLATATARAGDDTSLAELRVKYGKRIGVSPLGDMFRLLTAEPIRTTADIKRSQQEMGLAASLPTDLKALQGTPVSR